MNSETVRTTAEGRFTQGDILNFAGEQKKDPTFDLGVIINADCDLENEKLEGLISYLPIYSLRMYLERFWAPRYITDVFEQALRSISQMCSFRAAETEDLRHWLSQSAALDQANERIIAKFGTKKGTAETLKKALSRVACCRQEASSLERLANLANLDTNPASSLAKQLAAGRQAIGDAGFVINEIVGLNQLGYVVRLSRVLSIPAERCFSSESHRLSEGSDSLAAVRIASLSPTYKYRIAQLFANQFSRIGLPNELLELEKISIQELAESLQKESTK